MEEINVIYNRYGKPIFRLLDDGRFVFFNGLNQGFLIRDSLYDYRGRHIGWFLGGLIRDHQGHVVGFGENVIDSTSPYLPYKQYKPFASYVRYEPYRPYLSYEPYRPYKSYLWSSTSLENLFAKK